MLGVWTEEDNLPLPCPKPGDYWLPIGANNSLYDSLAEVSGPTTEPHRQMAFDYGFLRRLDGKVSRQGKERCKKEYEKNKL